MTMLSGAKLGRAVLGMTLAAVAFAASVSNAHADDYPSQPIKLIVPCRRRRQ